MSLAQETTKCRKLKKKSNFVIDADATDGVREQQVANKMKDVGTERLLLRIFSDV